MNKTSIEWVRTYQPDGSFDAGYTTNPIRFSPKGGSRSVTMCQKVSPGCTHCYAERITRRWWPRQSAGKFPGYTAAGVSAGYFAINLDELTAILRHKKPCKLFWGDMTDLFQERVPDAILDSCFATAVLTPHITHIFLTKRPERLARYFLDLRAALVRIFRVAMGLGKLPGSEVARHLSGAKPMPNWWLGFSAEDQQRFDERWQFMREPARAGWLTWCSAEPLLGPITTTMVPDPGPLDPDRHSDVLTGESFTPSRQRTGFNHPRLNWIVAGGESGPCARPMHPDWARNLRDQCVAAGVPFFFKQWGEWTPGENVERPTGHVATADWFDNHWSFSSENLANDEGHIDDEPDVYRVGKKAAGALLDGVEWHQFPAGGA